MLMLILVLLQQAAPRDVGFEALMLRIPNSALGECMVFVFEKDDQVHVGFYVIDGKPKGKPVILHLSTFLEKYLAASKERLREDSERLKLDLATIAKLNLAITQQVSLIKRRANRLSAEIEKVGLVAQLEDQSTDVQAAGTLLASASGPVSSASTLYTKILSSNATTEIPHTIQLAPQFHEGGFASVFLSDPAWNRKTQNASR